MKSLVVTSSFIALLCVVACVTDCPQGSTGIDGVCYGVFKEKKSWNDAKQSCIAKGGFLAEPKGLLENKNIVDLVKANGGGNAWIGATDKVKEGSWVWDHSETSLTFTAWAGREPNNVKGREDCAHLSVLHGHNYRWNDISCNRRFSFVCQENGGIGEDVYTEGDGGEEYGGEEYGGDWSMD